MKPDVGTLFQTGGEMAARMSARRWSETPLGPPSSWPQSLRAIVRVMLTSRYAMWMAWGPDLTFFCNDAYLPTLGVKETWALGASARKVWEEIWPDIGPRIDHVLATGEATWDEALLLFLERSGFPEETYHTFSYSPLWDDSGKISGMLCVVTEETTRVIGERRLAALRDFAAELSRSTSESEVFAAAERCLENARHDFPFTAVYLSSSDRSTCGLAACAGTTAGSPLAPHFIDSRSQNGVWPVADVLEQAASVLVSDLENRFAEIPRGPWPKAPAKAIVLPLTQAAHEKPIGFFIAGLNPFLLFDDAYQSFTNLFVGQLSSGLSNARAYDAERKRAEALAEIDRSKTIFFGNVSHEFRTPLTLMLGPLLDTLAQQNGPLPSRAANELMVVHRNGLRLLKLVNTLLDFSRIEAGRFQAFFVPTDLAAFTAELASVFRSAIERAGLRLTIDAPPLSVPAYIDRDMWEKVVHNLISNALKFTLAGEITVGLKQAGKQIQMAVQDTGIGIPAGELPRLFERFHRVEGRRGRTHEGTGIGLALVQELVKMHGGTVSVESEVDRGSIFTVSIPVGKDHLPGHSVGQADTHTSTVGFNAFVEEAMRWLPNAVQEGPGSETELQQIVTDEALLGDPHKGSLTPAAQGQVANPQNRAARPRILIADDNADMRDYLKRLLNDRYEVIAVSDGEQALRRARESTPALILSDVMMPNRDGFALLHEVRSDTSLASVPVILLSARAGEEAVLEGIGAGADEYLIKPFSARELVARVDAQIQRKQFERWLADAEQRLQAALSAAKMAVLEWEPETDAVSATGSVTDVFGVHPNQPLRSRTLILDLIYADDLDRYVSTTQAAADSGQSFQSDFRIIRPKDGCMAWLEERSHPTRDSVTGRTHMVSLVIDVTKRKETEIALKESERRREEMLATERAAREEAERVIRMKDEFLATLSHELRTPLNAILGWAEILNRDPLELDDARQGLQAIERNTRAQAQMIEDLLDMSRISSGKVRLNVQRLLLTEIVSQAVQSVLPSAEVKGVRLTTVLDPKAGPVAGDAGRLQQVLWNLLTNAIKFTPKGGRIHVLLERVNSHIELSVTDTGEGIEPEFLPHVFERFRQADASTTRRYRGLGLGLSIVKHLVELHGGSVRVKSLGKGKGSTFIMTLPLVPTIDLLSHDEGEERQHPQVSRNQPRIHIPPDLQGLTVLVVDDDPDARDVIARILRDSKASVITASSAAEAFEKLNESKPALLISDIGMPGEDGYELIRKIRAFASEANRRIPAVALTAFARSEDRQRALLAGYQLHVAKPVEPSELLTVCASLAGRIL